ncbi:MAG: sensor histidine kinase [Tepidisphaeraceae bacterium]
MRIHKFVLSPEAIVSASAFLKQLAPRRSLIARGESEIASIGLGMSAILLAATAAMAWWTVRNHKQALTQARTEQVHAVGSLMSQSAEVMLAADEISSLRRLVTEAAGSYDLSICRVVLSGGGVIADFDASHVNTHKLSESLPPAQPTESFHASATAIEAVFPLLVTGRCVGHVEINAPITHPLWEMGQTLAGVGAVGAATLSGLLLVYRRARRRLATMGAIASALSALSKGEADESALVVDPTLGMEAGAWNRLLAERAEFRRRVAGERVAEALGSRRGGRGDLDAAFDALAQGVLLVEETMRIKHANGACANFLRTKREDLVGAEVSGVIQQPDVIESIRSVIAGSVRKKATIEVERQGDDGAGVLRFSVRPVRRGDSAAAMIIIEDITQQRVAEESRSAFVAHATHELRTPLTNIRLYVETAMEDGENDAALRGKCLNVINQEARRLERIVGEMLSVSEIEAGSLRLKTDDVRLEPLLEDLKTDYVAQADEKKIALHFALPPKLPVIRGDRDKILVALHNLVGNALKYTPENGKVEVRVETDGKNLTFSVSDSGIGISDEDQERIFERFYRAKDPRVEKITGTGLGLTLAREVVRLHGGDITVRSEINKGSTFTLTLPALPEAA